MRIAVHGGVGAPASFSDGCERAARAGLDRLRSGEAALEGAIAAAVALEDDGRFNAGTGAALRMDGRTMEMDAALMTSDGLLASVACVSDVKNPVLLAREVSRTPHLMLVGDGATAFARKIGLAPHPGPTARAVTRHREVMVALRRGDTRDAQEGWGSVELARVWNFPTPITQVPGWGGSGPLPPAVAQAPDFACDTIGAVAMDGQGRFAVAASTGGSAPMLRGRVGDTPIVGCGFYAGPDAAVAATGIGEEIVRRFLCKVVYDWIAAGTPLQEALDRGVALFPAEVPVGLIAVSRDAAGTSNNREMPGWVAEA